MALVVEAEIHNFLTNKKKKKGNNIIFLGAELPTNIEVRITSRQ